MNPLYLFEIIKSKLRTHIKTGQRKLKVNLLLVKLKMAIYETSH
jgi:hypothetical protein